MEQEKEPEIILEILGIKEGKPMKRGHEMRVCEDRLVAAVLAFIWLRFALKQYRMPLALYVPLMILDVAIGLAAACKLYNLWE